MTRFLILIMALNALFTPVSIASACAPNMGVPMSSSTMLDLISEPDSMNQSGVSSVQIHCDNCSNMGMDDMSNMNCDAGCGISCLTSPVAMISSPALMPANVDFIKPVFGTIHFYTRTISPELRPPLV